MAYEFQLVLQLPADSPLTILDLEDEIAEALGNPEDEDGKAHLVDGNNFGGGTLEVFIDTIDPVTAFALTKPLLESNGLLDTVTAAYRTVSEENFKVIWPVENDGTFHTF